MYVLIKPNLFDDDTKLENGQVGLIEQPLHLLTNAFIALLSLTIELLDSYYKQSHIFSPPHTYIHTYIHTYTYIHIYLF